MGRCGRGVSVSQNYKNANMYLYFKSVSNSQSIVLIANKRFQNFFRNNGNCKNFVVNLLSSKLSISFKEKRLNSTQLVVNLSFLQPMLFAATFCRKEAESFICNDALQGCQYGILKIFCLKLLKF